uniref:exodeoxyribonuclease III n=1 Tax=Rousettus aegyptiacus TaxID=9407 RepID=A0A7J8JGQ9_ROUAE|nr:hypothetical protein HJG63_010205 [Rousettus aegyptiacus]
MFYIQIGYKKTSYFNNHPKYKWTELTDKKTQICRMDQKTKLSHILLKKTHLSSKDKFRLKVKGWKMIFQVNGIQRKVGVVVLISDEIDFKIKKVKKAVERHLIKRIIHQEDIILINIYGPNRGAPKYIKQLLTELKGETDQNTIIVGELNTPLSDMDRLSKQKVNKEITSFTNTLDQLDIIDIYRAFPPKTAAYTFFSSAHGRFSRIDHILGHRDSLNKYKRVEIIPTIFSDHNALKLEITAKRKQEEPQIHGD